MIFADDQLGSQKILQKPNELATLEHQIKDHFTKGFIIKTLLNVFRGIIYGIFFAVFDPTLFSYGGNITCGKA